jgi:hypothetical protein
VRTILAIVAVVVTVAVFGVLRWQARRAIVRIGFWYDDVSYQLPSDATARLGGPLTRTELASIEQISRGELEHAFAEFRIAVTRDRLAFWRVRVVQNLNRDLNSGESMGLGPLGGTGAVGFATVAVKAIQYAEPGAPRQRMIGGIGRGIGRVAAHEFAHQILGVSVGHNQDDPDSYEYPSPDRASQYYGELHWTIAGPLLMQKLGH